MAYNFDHTPNRRNTAFFSKWTAYPADVIPMWVADADFPTAPQIISALHKKVEHGALGYELPSNESTKVIAARMKNLYHWDVDPSWTVYTAGVNNGYNIAARILCSSKKGYLIQTPVYNEFLDTEHKTGARQRVARLETEVEGNRIKYKVDFDAFEKRVKKSGMFLLCHPHNPVGKIYSRADLKRMAEICIENNVTIVSDEIHSELLLGDAKFMPLAKVSREIEKRTITMISASKAFNVPGLACAFAIIPDEKLRKQFIKVAEGMSFEASTPGLTAAQIAYSGKADSWLNALRCYLTGNRDFVMDYVKKNLPGVRTTKPDATYLIWLDCSQLNLKPSPYEFFLKEAKVALSDGVKFGKGNEQFVRLNFGTSRRILEQGLERMRKALG
ncbi:MAG: PatB family C-S lyase [Anaerolineales bacterium]|nr:MAG: PatB family C-S lyase [Anaerolineales bacterium]